MCTQRQTKTDNRFDLADLRRRVESKLKEVQKMCSRKDELAVEKNECHDGVCLVSWKPRRLEF